MRGVSIRRAEGGAIISYWSDNLPRVEAVYTDFGLALEAATAWLGGERDAREAHGSAPPEAWEPRQRGVIGIPFDPPENLWERDE